jgi:hypothetical protein
MEQSTEVSPPSSTAIYLCVDVLPTFSLLAKLESHLKDQSAFKELQELYNDFVTFLEVCTSVLQLMIWCSR